ncbi:MAG: hypothetical protein EZS28_038910 [Streblomastix strix]|uniref:Uncharacterized protein n=1 Tax=Streblomastix strix TaxID=222440 RepID=A0A5J4U6I6_9EUKA|nr:MAG: hypothetical protein EZS28_038910 [Streblomastix strix]
MDLQLALKNLIENGTNIEYFDNGYVIQINKDIKVFEEGKKTLKKLTQTQQNKLLLQARGGGLEPKKKIQKQPQKQLEEDEDFISYEPQDETEGLSYAKQIDSDNDSISEVREKPLKKQVRKRVVKTSKTPQINYTNPQLDLEELIRLRTENSFIKQQLQDAVKQIEKYKQKVKRYKQPKEKETKAPKEQVIEQIQAPQECQEEHVQYEEQYRDINFDLY